MNTSLALMFISCCCIWDIKGSRITTNPNEQTSNAAATGPNERTSNAADKTSVFMATVASTGWSTDAQFDDNDNGTVTIKPDVYVPILNHTIEMEFFHYSITPFQDELEEATFIVDNDKATREYIASFSNDLQRQHVKTQLLNCPYVSLCNYTLPLEQFLYPSHGRSCCETCRCDYPGCLDTNTCCPDILEPLDFSNSEDKPLRHCIPNELYARTSNVRGVVGFAICPSSSSSELKDNCTRKYQTKVKYFEDLLPCISYKTSKVYRNIYCAVCHGEMKSDLEFFKMKLSGLAGSDRFQSTQEEWINMIFNRRIAVAFEYPYAHMNIEDCSTTIDSCNVTGLWTGYNATIAEACAMYTSEVRIGFPLTYYRNIFCALCNGEDITVGCLQTYYNTDARPYGFSGLLNSKLSSPSNFDEGRQRDKCEKSQFYNQITDVCVQTVCSPIHTMLDGECIPMYSTLTDMPYTLYVRLIPTQSIRVYEILFDMENIIKSLQRVLPEAVSNTLCETQALLVTSDDTFVAAFEEYSVEILYIQVTLQFYFLLYHEHNTTQLIEDLERSLHNNELLVGSLNFTMKIIVNEIMTTCTYDAAMANSTRDEELPWYLCDVNNYPIITDLLPTFGKTCSIRETTIPFFDILSLQSCLKVNISVDKNWTEFKNDGSMVLNNTIIIDSNRYIASSFLFDGTILVCVEEYEKYLDALLNSNAHGGSFSPEVIVSLICSGLSILSLTFTSITFLFLPKLRATLPGKNNLTLVLMLLLANVLFIVSSIGGFEQNSVECKAVGLMAHLQWLLAIFWMNICTYHMFRTLTKNKLIAVGTGCHQMLIYHSYALVLSLGFVAVNTTVSSVREGFVGYGSTTCYISSTDMVLYTFALPVGCIILSNIVMFLAVVIKIKRSPSVQKSVKNDRNNLLVFAKLSTITGLTWIFGVINIWIKSVVLEYIFSVLNASQGLLIFLAFAANMRVVNLYRDSIRRYRDRERTRSTFYSKYRTESTSVSITQTA